MRHTPGPWKQPRPTLDGKAIFIADSTGNWDICLITPKFAPSVEEAQANARLIASAPDMLDMLQELSQWLTCPDCSPATVTHIKERIDAVIARAEEVTPC